MSRIKAILAEYDTGTTNAIAHKENPLTKFDPSNVSPNQISRIKNDLNGKAPWPQDSGSS